MGFELTKIWFSEKIKLLYLIISLVLIYAEYLKDENLLYLVKPFLIPTLFFLYLMNISKKEISRYFILSLFFIWIANICFISSEKKIIVLGILNTCISRLFVLILILKSCKPPKPLPFIIGTFPFVIIFITVLGLLNDKLGDALYFVLFNGLLVILLGGVALANYFITTNRINTYVLISVILFTFMRFIVAIDFYYLSLPIFRPITIAIFSVAQYVLYMAVIAIHQEKQLNNNASTDS